MTSEQLRNTFQSPFDINRWYNLLHDIFKASELKVTPEKINDDPDEEGYYLGNVATADYYRIGFFIFNIRRGSVANRRVGLRRLVRNFTNPRWGEFDAALVIFNENPSPSPNPDSSPWRLSFISDIKGKATAPKRYTYVFGFPDLLYKTPIERFAILQKKGITFENLMTAFSVEALSDEFFDKYREQYADFIQYITGKRFVKSGSKWEEKKLGEPNDKLMQAFNHDEKKIRDYIKKMMGRITFLHFLQRKGWMCGDLNYMQNMFQNSAYKNDYLDSVLEPLFFGILNTKPAEREALFTEYGWDKNLLHEWRDIPYLNGGLFERDDTDEPESRFPAEYFQRLFQFFSEYNFTIDENDPNDAEVGVDPEMLGKIFENLLEDNKDKGAFYTPKEIVRYMCQESLIAYLETSTTIAKDKIRQFVLTPEEGVAHIPDNKKDKLLNALKNVKICDPAIGSGAFPMGLLNELLKCREALTNSPTVNCKLSIVNSLKKEIIQNNIYGVDIEKGAVDIARLRFWLSIVVDEEEASPLPNLDYKIMQGNSLIESYKGMDLSRLTYDNKDKSPITEYSIFDDDTNQLQRRVTQLLTQYYSCSDHEQKHRLQRDISHAISQQLELQKFDPAILHELKHINLAENTHFFLWHTWFSDVFNKGGFDIVIGNPPYFLYQESHVGEIADLRSDKDYTIAFGGKLNAYKLFIANAVKKLLSTNGINCFIFQNSFLGDRQATNLRKYILKNDKIIKIDSFPERDSKKKRVFESVKMSVCISLIQNTKVDSDYVFPVYVWDDKYKSSGLNTSFSLNDITAIDSVDYTIPRLRPEYKTTVIKLLRKKEVSIKCIEGELNVTFHKKFFGSNISNPIILKGASIQRYYYTHQMSQGQIDYLEEDKYFLEYGTTDKSAHHKYERIAMQGMTGANDKIRLVMSIVPQGYYLANSCNYILPSKSIDLYCLLGILNSKVINWFFRCFSTNSNVNGYEVDNFPIPQLNSNTQTKISELVHKVIAAKRSNNSADTSVFEKQIDEVVYQAYELSNDDIRIIEESV